MHFASFAICHDGLTEYSKRLREIPNQRTTTHFHYDEPENTKVTASFKVSDLMRLTGAEGELPDLLAKSVVVSLYARWDEFHRPRIAAEHLVSRKAVRSELMGDLRLIRHCIVHASSSLTSEPRRLKEIPWQLQPGKLALTKDMMNKLFNRLNREHITIDPSPSAQ